MKRKQVHPTKEWSVQPNLATSTSINDRTSDRTSNRTSAPVTSLNTDSKLYTDNDCIVELVRVIGNDELSISQMMYKKGLKHRQSFMEVHLEPALREKFVRRKYPKSPHHPRQKYLLTVKGLALYNVIVKEQNVD